MKYLIFGVILGCLIWSTLLLAIISGTLINIKKLLKNLLAMRILNEKNLASTGGDKRNSDNDYEPQKLDQIGGVHTWQ